MPIENYSPQSGGAISVIIRQIAEQLEQQGHQVVVVSRACEDSPYAFGSLIEFPDSSNAKFISLVCNKIGYFRYSWDYPRYGYYIDAVSSAIKSTGGAFDKIICFNDLHAPRYLKRNFPESKMIVWLQNECRSRQKDIRATVQSTYRFLTCSEYIRQWTMANHYVPSSKIIAALSGVNTADFPPPSNLIARGPLQCIVVGRLDRNKGQDLALEAVGILQREGLDVRLSIVGDVWFYKRPGDLENSYRSAVIQRVGELKNSSFLGHRPHSQLAKIYREHQVSLVLSRSEEPFGLVSLESMASGCAVISSNRGGLPESCGNAAVLLDPEDVESIATCLRKMYFDREFLAEMRMGSIVHAGQSSWDKTAMILSQC